MRLTECVPPPAICSRLVSTDGEWSRVSNPHLPRTRAPQRPVETDAFLLCPQTVRPLFVSWPDLAGLISLAICGVAERANPQTCRRARAEARRWASTQEDSYERACSRGANPFLASLTRVRFVKCDGACLCVSGVPPRKMAFGSPRELGVPQCVMCQGRQRCVL